MTIESWLIYLVLVSAATATPGPAVLFIITSSIMYGWKKAFFAALGNIAGLLCLGILAVTGLGTIMNSSVAVFNVIKFIGAAYLVYLGLKLVFYRTSPGSAEQQLIAHDISAPKIFVQAMAVALSNPKAVLFLTALLPQFVDVEKPIVVQCTILVAVLMLFSFVFLMLYALLAQQGKRLLSHSTGVKRFARTSGTIYIGFGILLATSSAR